MKDIIPYEKKQMIEYLLSDFLERAEDRLVKFFGSEGLVHRFKLISDYIGTGEEWEAVRVELNKFFRIYNLLYKKNLKSKSIPKNLPEEIFFKLINHSLKIIGELENSKEYHPLNKLIRIKELKEFSERLRNLNSELLILSQSDRGVIDFDLLKFG